MSFVLSSSLLRNVFPSDSPFATTYRSPSVLPRDPDPLPQFPYRKLHQVLLASSQDVWSLLYISFLCRWRGKAMPEIRVIDCRSGGGGTREASRDYLDLEEGRSKLRTLLVACPRAPYKPLQGSIRPMLHRAQFFPSTHASKRPHRLFYEASFRTRSHSPISL